MEELTSEVFRFAEEHSEDSRTIAALNGLRGRWKQQAASIVVVGEVSNGKSTLINALVESIVLPVAAKPLSSTWVGISWSDRFLARASVERDLDPRGDSRAPESPHLTQYRLQAADLPLYLTVDGQPEILRRHGRSATVQSVEIGLPARILEDGLTLIDTPGVGGLEAAHRQAALAALRRADAVILTTSCEEPISKSERQFLAEAIEHVAVCIFAFTMRDKVADADRVVREQLRLLSDADEWTTALGGDRNRAQAIATSLGRCPAVAVSATNRLTSLADRSLPDESHMGVLEDLIRVQVVDRVREVHTRNVLKLCRILTTSVGEHARSRADLLELSDRQVHRLDEREKRLGEWTAAGGEQWVRRFKEEVNGVARHLEEIANQRADELHGEYHRALPHMSSAKIKATVAAVADAPGTVYAELLASAESDLRQVLGRIRALLADDNLDGPLTELLAVDDVAAHLHDGAWEAPDKRLSIDDLVGFASGTALGATVATTISAGLTQAGLITAASVPVLWPALIGGVVVSTLGLRNRSKARAAGAAQDHLARVTRTIQTDVVELARDRLKAAALVVQREIEAGLTELSAMVKRDRQILAEAEELADHPGKRKERVDELRLLAADADELTNRADKISADLHV